MSELKFKTEDDKIVAMQELQEKISNGKFEGDAEAELEKIGAAAVENSDPMPKELPEEEEETPVVPEKSAGESQEKPAPKKTEASGDTRKWVIDEDAIPKDTYYDPKERRQRPFITQKTPEDLFKSYISGQKYIHHLETTRLPQETQAAYDKAKTEITATYEKQKVESDAIIADLRKKLEGAAAAPVAPAPSGGSTKLKQALEKMRKLKPDDSFEPETFQTITEALQTALENNEELSNKLNQFKTHDPEKLRQDISAKVLAENQKLIAESEKKNVAVAEAQQRQKMFESACAEIDAFSTHVGTTIPDMPKLGRSFKDADADAIEFKKNLGVLFTGKPASQIDNNDIEAATSAYITKLPALLGRVDQSGINVPKDFDAWFFYDTIDALRTGFLHDPTTGKWSERFDPTTGKRVNFPDLQSAFDEYMRLTGQDEINRQRANQKGARQALSAVAKRDKGIVTMDPSRGSRSADYTEEEAVDILKKYGGDYELVYKAHVDGNDEPLNELNRALIAVGSQPIQF
jgi:hypothetical protein